MKILFISRSYPPVIGGIERQNYDLYRCLSKREDVLLIANTRGKSLLALFLPYAFIKALSVLHRVDIILLGDGVLAVLGYFLKFFARKPVVCIVHGLDVTFKNSLYQKLWPFFFKKINTFIAVSHETIRQGTKRGITMDKFSFIPNGVSVPAVIPRHGKKDLEKILGRPISQKVLLTVGRLVQRKGIEWFIGSVMANLADNVVYIIAGDGPQRSAIIDVIERNSLQGRIFCLGRITEGEKAILYSTADLFIQPNIKVKGDIEGFGLVVLEAASYGLPVIATDIEGLKDAIKNDKNGILVQEKNAVQYKARIEYLLMNDEHRRLFGAKAREYVTEHYAMGKIAARYRQIFENLLT